MGGILPFYREGISIWSLLSFWDGRLLFGINKTYNAVARSSYTSLSFDILSSVCFSPSSLGFQLWRHPVIGIRGATFFAQLDSSFFLSLVHHSHRGFSEGDNLLLHVWRGIRSSISFSFFLSLRTRQKRRRSNGEINISLLWQIFFHLFLCCLMSIMCTQPPLLPHSSLSVFIYIRL